MSSNVLPSAPPGVENENWHSTTVQQSTELYPLSEIKNAENFRLTEISKNLKEISDQIEHYRLVLKKYKKVQKVIHYSAVSLGAMTTVLSSGTVGTSLTGLGILAGVPLAGIAILSGGASTGLSVINKTLERKVNKHSRIHALAVAKHDSINSFVSQALNDNHVSDTEFQLITREMHKYRELKENLRSHFAQKQTTSRQPDQPDIKKIRNEIREEFRKKSRRPAQI